MNAEVTGGASEQGVWRAARDKMLLVLWVFSYALIVRIFAFLQSFDRRPARLRQAKS